MSIEKRQIVDDSDKRGPLSGNIVSVAVYRLVLYSIKATLDGKYGEEEARSIFY